LDLSPHLCTNLVTGGTWLGAIAGLIAILFIRV